MKRLLLCTSAAILIMTNASLAQIPNASFENWTSMGSYSNPDNWDNLNAMTSSMSIYTATKGTPGNPGTSYLKLTSKNVTMMGVMPGVAVSGVLSTSTYQAASGFAFTQRPQNLTGAWQFMAAGADSGFVAVYLTKWNAALAKRDTVAMVRQNLSGMVMSWTNFSIPLMYMGGANPDSAMITLSSSGATPVANSYLYVDNLAFTGSVAGIKENNVSTASVHLFPNPATDKLVVSSNNLKASTGQIEIYDIIGNKVKSLNNVDFTNNTTIDVADLTQGGYFIKISTTQGVITKKFLKQ